MANSSRVAGFGYLTLSVMGGKSGKIAARNGKVWQWMAQWAAKTARCGNGWHSGRQKRQGVAMDGTVGGKNGKVWWGCGHLHALSRRLCPGPHGAEPACLPCCVVVQGASGVGWRHLGRTNLPYEGVGCQGGGRVGGD